MPAVTVRPMREDDVMDVNRLCADVLYPPSPVEEDPAQVAGRVARIRHLGETDPGGAWVAERDGRVEGISLAFLREGLWGFSLFAVADALRGTGLGRELFARAWAYGADARGHLILSSTNPAAMRTYARAGLRLRPCVAAAGIPDLTRAPDLEGIEEAGADGLALADAIGRELRGAGYARDLAVPLAHGARLFVCEDRAFGILRRTGVMILGARDEEAAERLLWALLVHAGPGATVAIEFLTAGQDWAVQVALDAGLPLSPDGPFFVGGKLGPLAPYIPSGAHL